MSMRAAIQAYVLAHPGKRLREIAAGKIDFDLPARKR